MTHQNEAAAPAEHPYRATFYKLRSGDWGARIVGEAPPVGGVAVLLRRRGGAVPKLLTRLVTSGETDAGEPFALFEIDDAPAEPAAKPAPAAAVDGVAGVDAWTRGALAALTQRLDAVEADNARLQAQLRDVVAALHDVTDTARRALGVARALATVEPEPARPAPIPEPAPSPVAPPPVANRTAPKRARKARGPAPRPEVVRAGRDAKGLSEIPF